MLLLFSSLLYFSSCNSGKKTDQATVTHTDTTHTAATIIRPSSFAAINLPHADSGLIPVVGKLLDEALEASTKKDYNTLASLLVYRGPDDKRNGLDVFNAKNKYEKNVTRITGEVFNKWTRNVESKEYSRIFEMDQPGNRKLVVLEVLFVTRTNINRKFFGFLKLKDEYKIADVTSSCSNVW